MPRYLRASEAIYNHLKNNTYFMSDPSKDFRILMTEIKKTIAGTELKLLYSHLDFENLTLCNGDDKIFLDISIIPKIINRQEFILWLASFIERITEKPKIASLPSTTASNSEVVIPRYVLKAQSRECNESAKAIEEYYKQLNEDKDTKSKNSNN